MASGVSFVGVWHVAGPPRGSFWYEAGGVGVADTVEVCRKDSGNAYAWVSVI